MSATLAYRRVFGVLVPYFNTAVEPELADLRPAGVWNQTARFILDANVLDNIAARARQPAATERRNTREHASIRRDLQRRRGE